MTDRGWNQQPRPLGTNGGYGWSRESLRSKSYLSKEQNRTFKIRVVREQYRVMSDSSQ